MLKTGQWGNILIQYGNFTIKLNLGVIHQA